MTELTPDVSAKLRAPFADVSWRVQSVLKNDKTRARVVAYIDARDVMDRLDDAVGPDVWSFDWEPVTMANNQILTVKGKLTVCGITRCDIGEAGDIEKSKAAVSDALKRAAVHFGIGRWLYDMKTQLASINEYGDILAPELARLNSMLANRIGQNAGQTAARPTPATPPAAPAQAETKPETNQPTNILSPYGIAAKAAQALGIGDQQLKALHRSYLKKNMDVSPEAAWGTITDMLNDPHMGCANWGACNNVSSKVALYIGREHITEESLFNDLHDETKRGEILQAMREMAA